MTSGYAARASVLPGETLVLHVSTTAARFRVALYQWLGALRHIDTGPWLQGQHVADGVPESDWQWPAYPVTIPAASPSGVYIAHLEDPDGAPPQIAMGRAAVLFVVRSRAPGALLYKIALATYNAYNLSGGGCFYCKPPVSLAPPGAKLTFHRPGVGIGGPVFGADDFYDPASPRQTFAHWDAPFIQWLYAHGYAASFCTDLDLHQQAPPGASCRLLLSVGHDEYWSGPMRQHAEQFIAGGGNAAFFSGNVCWWRIHLTDDGTAMVCHQGSRTGARDHWWPPTGVGAPEDSLSGLSYRHGGGWWDGPRERCGYRVVDHKHWAFAGTNLNEGAMFGGDTVPPLAGYECDGAPVAGSADEHAVALHPAAHQAGTPPGLHLLAWARLDGAWQERPTREPVFDDGVPHAAVMAIFRRGGQVFAAGTSDWAQVLASGDRIVGCITRNVLDHLAQRHQRGSQP